jgi:flagellar protein FlbD
MIAVTRFDGHSVLLNDDLIETIERTPDTVLTLVNGHKLLVRETPDELVRRVVLFRREISAGAAGLTSVTGRAAR